LSVNIPSTSNKIINNQKRKAPLETTSADNQLQANYPSTSSEEGRAEEGELEIQQPKSKRTKFNHHNQEQDNKASQKQMKLEERKKTQFNINRSDLIRVMIQALQSLDLCESAEALERESGIRLHEPAIAQFRQDILKGNWDSVSNHLNVLGITSEDNLHSIQFLIARQKFLEYLESKKLKQALKVLREEVAPVCRDTNQLHKLASLIICTDTQILHKRAKWDGAQGNSRKELINDLHKYIPPHLMVPENRLEKLLLQAVQYQKERHMIHDGDHEGFMEGFDSEISLLTEDIQPARAAPRDMVCVLEDHKDEVWFAQFSPNGRYLATCSTDKTALIYDLSKIPEVWKHLNIKSNIQQQDMEIEADGQTDDKPVVCTGHTDKVTYLSWSPSSDKLLTCSDDLTIRLWNVQGQLLQTFSKHRESVCAVHWSPDGSFFVSAGSGSDKTFFKWDAQTYETLDRYTADYRIQDFALDPKYGDRVCAVSGNRLHVFHLSDSTNHFTLQDSTSITCVTLSHDGRYALCSLSSNSSYISKATVAENIANGNHGRNTDAETFDRFKAKIHMWDLNERRLVREFTGHEQTKYVLRCCFSAYPRFAFVCCGSEDGGIYIWNTEDGTLLNDMPLKAHINTVNSICWNEHGRVIASAGDDCSVRIFVQVDRVKEI